MNDRIKCNNQPARRRVGATGRAPHSSMSDDDSPPAPADTTSDVRKVVVLFKATGDAPILRQNKVKVRADATFAELLAHLTKSTRAERAFAYLGAAFAPRYDATVGALCDGYGERNDEGGKLVVFYSTTPAWG